MPNPNTQMKFTAFITALNELGHINVMTDLMEQGYQEALVN
jgi:hypothetical protein